MDTPGLPEESGVYRQVQGRLHYWDTLVGPPLRYLRKSSGNLFSTPIFDLGLNPDNRSST